MLLSNDTRKIYLYNIPVDMRKSFNSLAALTREVLKENPLSGDLYVFTNRSGNLIKCLTWDRTGYVLYAKKLERGKLRYRAGQDKREINQERLKLLLDGISV